MYLQLEVEPQVIFLVSATSIGATQQTIEAVRNNTLTKQQSCFFWAAVRSASVYLMDVEPAGSC